MKYALIAAGMICASAALAEEPTLNDLPSILEKLRGCEVKQRPTFLGIGGITSLCQIQSPRDLWVAIDSNGHLTMYAKKPSSSEATYASGDTVAELLRAFAAQLAKNQVSDKAMLERLAPLLPTQ